MTGFWEFAHLTDSLRDLSHFNKVPLASRLYIGGLSAFYQEPDPLIQAGITHVLSVTDFRLGDARRLEKYKHFYLQADDAVEENLLRSFLRTSDFIESALASGGAVFVHCAMGLSRSATLVTAYLMHKYQLSAEDALAKLREGRPRCRPNEGFMRQLKVYDRMLRAKDYAEADEIYTRWLKDASGTDAAKVNL